MSDSTISHSTPHEDTTADSNAAAGNTSSTRETGRPDWKKWRDLVRDAFQEGRHAGTDAGSGSAAKLREAIEKGVYDTSFGLAYGLAFGSMLAREAVVRPARDGGKQGAAAGREAAGGRNPGSGQSQSSNPNPSSTDPADPDASVFCSI